MGCFKMHCSKLKTLEKPKTQWNLPKPNGYLKGFSYKTPFFNPVLWGPFICRTCLNPAVVTRRRHHQSLEAAVQKTDWQWADGWEVPSWTRIQQTAGCRVRGEVVRDTAPRHRPRSRTRGVDIARPPRTKRRLYGSQDTAMQTLATHGFG